MSSFRNGSQRIENMIFKDTIFNITPKDVIRSYKQYLQYKDMNGRLLELMILTMLIHKQNTEWLISDYL